MARERYSSDPPVDPFGAFNFRLELGGEIEAGFMECSGLDSETELIQYRNGDDDITPRKIPGLRRFGNITLRRGITTSTTLWDWRLQAMVGHLERRDVSVVLYDDSGQSEVARWNLRNAWPVKWQGPTLNATANEIAIEVLELAHEGVDAFVTRRP